MKKEYICPVCGFEKLNEPPYGAQGEASHEICLCCGFEFGYNDAKEGDTYASYRARWIKNGALWFDKKAQPKHWDLQKQLKNLSTPNP